MHIIIVGARPADPVFVHRSLSKLHSRRRITQISHGCSDPCALAAEAWAWARDVRTFCYSANWDRYGRRAEAYRDSAMLSEDHPDLLLAIGGGRRVARIKLHAQLSGVTIITSDLRDPACARPDATRFTRRALSALAGRQTALGLADYQADHSASSRILLS